jgi:hypothetical protein
MLASAIRARPDMPSRMIRAGAGAYSASTSGLRYEVGPDVRCVIEVKRVSRIPPDGAGWWAALDLGTDGVLVIAGDMISQPPEALFRDLALVTWP